jgi:hypothetical protein
MVAPSGRRAQEVLEAIRLVLAPTGGSLMARSAAVAHCRDLGIGGDFVSREQVDALLERLGLGLVIFVGRDKTAELVDAMKRAVEALPEAL